MNFHFKKILLWGKKNYTHFMIFYRVQKLRPARVKNPYARAVVSFRRASPVFLFRFTSGKKLKNRENLIFTRKNTFGKAPCCDRLFCKREANNHARVWALWEACCPAFFELARDYCGESEPCRSCWLDVEIRIMTRASKPCDFELALLQFPKHLFPGIKISK
jgi:hypothetical protein